MKKRIKGILSAIGFALLVSSAIALMPASVNAESYDIEDYDFNLSYTECEYTGEPCYPEVYCNALREDTDYEVLYDDDYVYPEGHPTNVGTYSVKIYGKGKYTGKEVLTYDIVPKEIEPTVTLSSSSFVYNGQIRKPTVTVKDGSTVIPREEIVEDGLRDITNYSVTYASGRKNVGRYSVKVTLQDNYKGSKTVYFQIRPKGTSIAGLYWTGNAFKIKWNKQSAKMAKTRITGYQIQVSTSKDFTQNKKIITVKGYSKIQRNIKMLGKKRHYFRVRTYKVVNGVKRFSNWSSQKYADYWKISASGLTFKAGKRQHDAFGLSRNGYGFPTEAGNTERHASLDGIVGEKSIHIMVTSSNDNIIVAKRARYYSNLGSYQLFAKKAGKATIKIKCVIYYNGVKRAVVTKDIKAKATGGKKNTLYDLGYDCVVKGKYAYCTNYHRLFRVNINTGKVKRLATTRRGYIDHLVVKGNYIYYSDHGNGAFDGEIIRINLSTGKRQILSKNGEYTFVIKGSKIYYNYHKSWWTEKGTKMVMSLSGKSKKKTKIAVKTVYNRSENATNVDDIYVWDDFDWDSGSYEDGATYYLDIGNRSVKLEYLDWPYM